jgi:HEPN domain-containing protein
MTDTFDYLAEAERLLAGAEQDAAQARPAAESALKALLVTWGVTPRGESVVALLDQAAETDDTLLHFRAEAAVLDRVDPSAQPDAADRAKIFVDAARARLANI